MPDMHDFRNRVLIPGAGPNNTGKVWQCPMCEKSRAIMFGKAFYRDDCGEGVYEQPHVQASELHYRQTRANYEALLSFLPIPHPTVHQQEAVWLNDRIEGLRLYEPWRYRLKPHYIRTK